ncbi:hypothetical protein [Marinomonas sp.]
MKFFKGKAAKWAATLIIGVGLTYMGVPPALVTSMSTWGGDQVGQMVTDD